MLCLHCWQIIDVWEEEVIASQNTDAIANTDISICPLKHLVLPQMSEEANSQFGPEGKLLVSETVDITRSSDGTSIPDGGP
ncbi:hypothetical protein WISP_56090 [Willisornis vidua]|uniref:Uncharacterized protein n=1 Tax=Willisornis vidua TaxID=1566151 RepID=A0ABQ9DC10_9PASS|nr:hypothetical protein WISP_56090 [Willisornis vidua]